MANFQRLEKLDETTDSLLAKLYNGRFANIASKSASIVTGVKDGRLVIEKVAGKYFMYWERMRYVPQLPIT